MSDYTIALLGLAALMTIPITSMIRTTRQLMKERNDIARTNHNG